MKYISEEMIPNVLAKLSDLCDSDGRISKEYIEQVLNDELQDIYQITVSNLIAMDVNPVVPEDNFAVMVLVFFGKGAPMLVRYDKDEGWWHKDKDFVQRHGKGWLPLPIVKFDN